MDTAYKVSNTLRAERQRRTSVFVSSEQAEAAAYPAVHAFPPRDQVTATTWAVVAVLSALRETPKDR